MASVPGLRSAYGPFNALPAMSVRILEGDALQVLRTLPDCSVQMCCTSPPYFGLRDYGTGSWEGGDVSCDHARKTGTTRGGPNSTLSGGQDIAPHATQFSGDCGKCGATRTDHQMGLEKTPDLYVEAMVGVFREVRRVLRNDGTLWLNCGDSYASVGGARVGGSYDGGTGRADQPGGLRSPPSGIKAKDLIGIPWLLAFALRADGWYLRSDIIWHKPNPMPESVTDRPTKSHEYLFLLSKSPTYYYDADAIAEPSSELSGWAKQRAKGDDTWKYNDNPARHASAAEWRIESSTFGVVGSRNRRSVWTVNTSPYSEAHFATFPPKLIEPCILAGSAKQACEKCGAPWERMTGRETPPASVYARNGKPEDIAAISHPEIGKAAMGQKLQNWYNEHPRQTLGFKPSCDCENSGTGKSLVLDPFGGAGTTGLVADRLGRDALLIELNPKYAEMARRRIHSDNPLFGDVA